MFVLWCDGQKMGKTATGAVWLDAERLSPFEYYQYWVNTHDSDVVRFLKLFTLLPVDEIENFDAEEDATRLNQAKSVLAFEATALLHGLEHAVEAHAAAQGAFGGRSIAPEVLPTSSVPRGMKASVELIPTTDLPQTFSTEGVLLVQAMIEVGLSESLRASRRLISQGAVRVNDAKVADESFILNREHVEEGHIVVRVGKKKVHRFGVSSEE